MSDNAIPKFAVAGQPNEGKTTVVATLSEDDKAEIGPRPGTTQRCQAYPVTIDGVEVLRFIDTPGFEDAEDAVEWFVQNEREKNPAALFIAEHRHARHYQRECELLRPIAEGAAIIYVVDASRPVRQLDRDEITILRLCGNPRVAVLNSKEADSAFLPEWKDVLRKDFPCVHRFNAHTATFQDRMKLLEAIKTVTQDWQSSLEDAIAQFRRDWDARLLDTADLFCDYLKQAATLSIAKPLDDPGQFEQVRAAANRELREELRKRELKFRQRARKIFKHSDEHWQLEENSPLGEDLFSEQVWRLFGLRKSQLIGASAVIGAILGGLIDLHAGGLTFFAGTLIGSGTGAAVGWLSAEKAVDVYVPRFKLAIPGIPFPIRIGGRKLGGRMVQASVNPQSNLLWIMTDRALAYVRLATSWSHGLRTKVMEYESDKARKIGTSSEWESDDRKVLANFIAQYRCEKSDHAKQEQAYKELRARIHRTLQAMTGER